MDIYQTVTDKIVAALESAQRWQKPWTSAFLAPSDGVLRRPVNAVSGKPYHGINVPILWSAGRSSPHWATYKAWQSTGAHVRRGEKGTLVVFWKQMTQQSDERSDDNEAGEARRNVFWLARGYVVFSAEQVEGWSAPNAPTLQPVSDPFAPIAIAEAFVSATNATIRHGGDRACYIPSLDEIRMPNRRQFVGTKTSTPAEAYYGTLLHELVHLSGHPSRCDRDLTGRFGSDSYAAEELVAELGAAFLCADLGIAAEPRADHANYLASWLRVLRDDKRAIFTAASKAEQATRYLVSSQLQQPATALAA